MNKFMELAISEAKIGISNNHGGPFGAVVVKDGEVVAAGHNHVVVNNDPTCHGEMDVIRKACQKLQTFDLSGCELYTTGEPCNMCLCACMWANIKKVYYACTIEDNELIGFRDNYFNSLLNTNRAALSDYLIQLDRDEGLKLFEEYNQLTTKTSY